MKKTIVFLSMLIMLTMTTSLYAKDCGEVSITEMDWASAQVITAVSKFLMEQGYGCKVSIVPSSTVPAITSLAETGKPDIVTELWVLSAPVYNDLEAAGKVTTAADVLSDGGVEGWWIPKYLADKYPELKTIQGVLKNPKLVGARFHNCPSGWACEIVNTNVTKALKLEANGIEVFQHGSGETLAASIAAAYSNKEPWFGYYWAPTAILGKYEMVKVDVGPHKPSVFKCVTKADCVNVGVTAYPSSKVITAVTTDFSSKNPQILELMQNVSFTNAQMNGILAWKKNNAASTEEAAVYFLSKNQSVWKKWVSKKAQKRLASLL